MNISSSITSSVKCEECGDKVARGCVYECKFEDCQDSKERCFRCLMQHRIKCKKDQGKDTNYYQGSYIKISNETIKNMLK